MCFLGGWGLFTSEFVGGGGSIVPLGHRTVLSISAHGLLVGGLIVYLAAEGLYLEHVGGRGVTKERAGEGVSECWMLYAIPTARVSFRANNFQELIYKKTVQYGITIEE